MNLHDPSQADSSSPAARGFLVVGGEKPLVLQVLLALRAAFAGAQCAAASGPKSRLLALSNLCSSHIRIGFGGEDDERFVDYANAQARAVPRLLVVPADCDGARLLGRVQGRLHGDLFPFPDAATIDCFDDKWRFHEFCMALGLNTPRTRLVQTKHELDFSQLAGDLGVPFVVKPLAECSTRGVEIVGDEAALRRSVLDNDDYRYAPLVVQQYIRGTDIGLNLLARNGELKAFAVQQRAHPQHDGAEITFLPNKYLEHVAHAVTRHGAYHGVMNIDARVEQGTGKVFLFEANPRFWRSLSASVWCGLNFVAECLEPLPSGEVRSLTSGRADTHDHPLLRGAMLRGALFESGQRGRLARAMMFDMCTLLGQVKEAVQPGPPRGRPDPGTAPGSELPLRTGS